MISILKDCFDRKGNRYKVISFTGNRYQCQSYTNGKNYFFESSEISDKPFNHEERTIDFLKVAPKEILKSAEIVEPVYDFTEEVIEEKSEPVKEVKPKKEKSESVKEEKLKPKEEESEPAKEEKPVEVKKPKQTKKSKDNIKETADDFYADF